MKTFILALCLLTSTATTSIAQTTNCYSTYSNKGFRRAENHRMLVAFGPIVLSVGLAFATLGAAAVLFPITLFTAPVWNNVTFGNQFKRIQRILIAADRQQLLDVDFEKFLNEVREKSFAQSGQGVSPEMLASILHDANHNLLICPLVKVKKNGREIRSAFTEKALMEYVLLEAARRQSSMIPE